MALSIGELVGYVKLDDSEVDTGLSGIADKLKGAAGGWKTLLGGAGLAAGGLFATTLVSGMNVEAGTDRMAAALGATGPEAERLGDVAGTLYAGAWGDSLEDVNGAVEAVYTSIGGMADASSAELEATTATAMDFAKAMQVDVGRAAQVAGQMVTNGLASNATEAFDLLTAASSKVPSELREDVLDATDEYGQFFKAVGIGGEQAMSMLVAASEQGMYGIDKTGDAIKEFTIRSTDMSDATKGAYEAIGLGAKDMTDKLLAGGETAGQATQQIIDGILGIKDPAKQSQAALALFGTPLEDMNTQEIPKFLESLKGTTGQLGEVDGAAARMGQTLNDNAMTNLTSFGRQLKTQAIDLLGGQLLPAVTAASGVLATNLGPALDLVGAALSTVGGFLAEHQTVLAVVAGIVTAVLVPALVAWAVQATITMARTAAMWVANQLGAIKAGAVMAVTAAQYVALFALMAAQATANAVRMAAAWVLAMGPVGWVIAAVVALVALIIANWDTVKRVTVKVWGAIVGAVKDAWAWAKAATVKAGQAILGAVTSAWEAVKGAVRAAVGFVAQIIRTYVAIYQAVWTTAWNAIKAVVSAVWGAIVAAIQGFVQRVVSVVRGIADLVGKFRTWFGQAKDAATGKLGELVSWVAGLPGKIVGALGNLGGLLVNAGQSIMSGLVQGITDGIGWVKDKLSSVTNLIPDWKGPMEVDARLLTDNGQAIMQSLVDGFQAGSGVVRRSLQELTGDLPGMLGTPQLSAAGAGGIDYDRLAEAMARRGDGDAELLDELRKLRGEVRRLPRTTRRDRRKGVNA